MRKLPNKERLAYLAGFLDGEGCIRLCRIMNNGKNHYAPLTRSNYFLHIHIAQKDKTPLKLYHLYFGGHFFHNKGGTWSLHIWNKPAQKLLEAVEPYLIVKKAQAILGIEYQKSKRKPGEHQQLTVHEQAVREAQFILMHNLKKGNVKVKVSKGNKCY